MIKFTILLKRNPQMTQEAFVSYHKSIHAQLFMSIPVVKKTVRRYVQQHALEVELPGLPPAKYDGITELWFDSVQDLGECFSDPEYLATVRPDEAKFLDLDACDFVVSTENPVKA
jgi:uncharacterized protein (TIGR02118 family)